MGKLDGQVAFITGAARGQGRAHALRLAQEGADIIAIDICQLTNAIPVEAVDAIDVANTVAWLASDEARNITGTVIPVDAGNVNRR